MAVDSIARRTVTHFVPNSRLKVFCLIVVIPSCTSTHIIAHVFASHIVLNCVPKGVGFRKMKEMFFKVPRLSLRGL
jgi:hypothetical protein